MKNNKKQPDFEKLFKSVRSRLQEVINTEFSPCEHCNNLIKSSDLECEWCGENVGEEFESDLFKKDMSDPNMSDGELGVYSVDYVKTLETMNRTLEAQVDSYKKKVGK